MVKQPIAVATYWGKANHKSKSYEHSRIYPKWRKRINNDWYK